MSGHLDALPMFLLTQPVPPAVESRGGERILHHQISSAIEQKRVELGKQVKTSSPTL